MTRDESRTVILWCAFLLPIVVGLSLLLGDNVWVYVGG